MKEFFFLINLSTSIYALLINVEEVITKPFILECRTSSVGNFGSPETLSACNISDIAVNIFETITDSLSKIVQQTRRKLPKDCADIITEGDCDSGVKTIYPYHCSERPVEVYCDQTIDGGGWTVFHNRDATLTWEDFNRTYEDYVTGFGNISGEYWLGLDNIRALTRSTSMELRIDLEAYNGKTYFASYPLFKIGDSFSGYKLEVENIYGDPADGAWEEHNQQSFLTNELVKENKNVRCPTSIIFRGPWWSKQDGSSCFNSNLNGNHDSYNYLIHEESLNAFSYKPYINNRYPYEYRSGIVWRPLPPIKRASMKIRRTGF